MHNSPSMPSIPQNGDVAKHEDGFEELLLFLNDSQRFLQAQKLKEWERYYSFPRLFVNGKNSFFSYNHLNGSLHSNSNGNQETNQPFRAPLVLQPSLFHKNNVPPTVYFNTKLSDDSRPPVGVPRCLHNCFTWKISSITPNSIRNCIAFMKFPIIKANCQAGSAPYLGSWCKHMLTTDFGTLEEWKKVNHYPGSFHLGRKDKLWFRLKLARQKFGKEEFGNFHPQTFVLPRDLDDLREYWTSNLPSNLFIIKPPASARGNGIKVINNITQIPDMTSSSSKIVQQYISNPCLLENGQKFDLRVYVLLTSVNPLRLYVYEEGLVRFASTKYNSKEDGIVDQYMHLTNYFINKNNREYRVNNDSESLQGCKWTLTRFWRYLKENYTRVNPQELWESIIDVIIRTVVCCEGPISRLSRKNCRNDYTSYELFGFDIILDESFKPWILEVNITPALKSESDLDTSVKYAVIKDMFNLVGYNLPPLSSCELNNMGLSRNSNLFFNKKLYTELLTKRDKLRHSRFSRLIKTTNDPARHPLKVDESQTDCNTGPNHRSPSSDVQCPTTDNDTQLNESASQTTTERVRGDFNSTEHVVNGSDNDDETDLIESAGDSLMSDLTQNDVRVLMLTEDELSRKGNFRRVFPSSVSSKYLRYFERLGYYDLLLDAWERHYRHRRLDGIIRLTNSAHFLESGPESYDC